MSRILYLPTRYFPAISGAEFYFQRMAEILTSTQNYKIDIFTSNALDFRALRSPEGKIITPEDNYYKKVNNLEIYRFPINYTRSRTEKVSFLENCPFYRNLNLSENTLKKSLSNGPYMAQLINFFQDHKHPLSYQLIHTTYYPYFNLIIALILGEIMNIPTMCTPFFHFSNPRYLDKDLLEILKKFDYLIACTNTEKKILVKFTGVKENNIKVIPMGVDYDVFNNPITSKTKNIDFKRIYFKPHERNYRMVLFCGYKNFEKGAISILKAIPLVYKQFKKIYFIFIGPPTRAFNAELSKLRKLKKYRIINLTPENLRGYFDKKKISAFQQADIFLMPSRSDAFGIAFLEAWASGTPVIGANIGATPEVIKHNQDGILVEFDNHKEIAEKILWLLNNPSLRKSFAKEGNLKVKSTYKWTNVAQQTDELYHTIVTQKPIVDFH
ncbi:MAG: D-inositol 3-phosphate glycosyltransferase [Promethearchaeota archaeon]|nr:MAG: D-inositol 3-phosphate glycosyltransferase [Candidatus Lokiarchaeota archaeon]